MRAFQLAQTGISMVISSANLASCALACLLAGCVGSPRVPEIPRVPWSSTQDLLDAVRSWPLATSAAAPWALHVLMPEELDEADFAEIHRAFEARGYGGVHASPSLVAELTDLQVRLVLADPVELHVATRAAAPGLWRAGIPFGTTVGNSCWLVLPRRAIPAAHRQLAGVVADADWREM